MDIFYSNNINDNIIELSVSESHHCMKVMRKKRGDTVIFPQMYGLPTEIKKRAGVNLIEDACQSLGSKVKGTYSGLQGHIGVFSFYATKLITSAGQGGMLVSKDKSLITEIKDFLKVVKSDWAVFGKSKKEQEDI